jgi:hypothetical protein
VEAADGGGNVLNTVTVEHMRALDTLGWRIQALPPDVRERVLREGIAEGVSEGLRTVRRRAALSGIGDDEAVTAAVQSVLGPLMPSLSAEIMKAVGPAAQKAADVVGPVIEDKIKTYGPILAIIVGVVAGIIALFGMAAVGRYVIARSR